MGKRYINPAKPPGFLGSKLGIGAAGVPFGVVKPVLSADFTASGDSSYRMSASGDSAPDSGSSARASANASPAMYRSSDSHSCS
jgi:hypothetical protein